MMALKVKDFGVAIVMWIVASYKLGSEIGTWNVKK